MAWNVSVVQEALAVPSRSGFVLFVTIMMFWGRFATSSKIEMLNNSGGFGHVQAKSYNNCGFTGNIKMLQARNKKIELTRLHSDPKDWRPHGPRRTEGYIENLEGVGRTLEYGNGTLVLRILHFDEGFLLAESMPAKLKLLFATTPQARMTRPRGDAEMEAEAFELAIDAQVIWLSPNISRSRSRYTVRTREKQQ